MEDPTPYRISLPKLELISSTHTQVTMHRDGITTHEHRHEYAYAGGIRILFANGDFAKAEFDMRNPYSRADWRRLAAIEAEITYLESVDAGCENSIPTAAPLGELNEPEFDLELLGVLNERERKIITSRFGLNGKPTKTLKAIAKEHGVTATRIAQIQKIAMQKLKQAYCKTQQEAA